MWCKKVRIEPYCPILSGANKSRIKFYLNGRDHKIIPGIYFFLANYKKREIVCNALW